MMARPTTSPVEAPSACRLRAMISPVMLLASSAPALVIAVSASPTMITGRRPNLSDSGPSASCEKASTIR